ncbi:MAG: HRDC domain-containing protein [Thermoanaerobaculales bacterium]|nr:HRDC domain-containing protein [Thermoanaerobaculales bacterium]
MPEVPRPIWIESAEGLRAVAERCAAAGCIALDTEADSMHSYFHKVCLVQVTADSHHAVIDPLALAPRDLEPLWRVVGDPAVRVLMHGADYDIRVLDRDYSAQVRGLEDTQVMAQLLGEPKTGLAALLEQELGVRLDKKHQRADWGQRPLTRSQVAYAAADTAYLAALAARLQRRLETLGRWSWAEEEFRTLEEVRFVAPPEDPLVFERIKGGHTLRGEARDRLFSLHRWRDGAARELDLPPFKILGNRQLLVLAEAPPGDLEALAAVEGVSARVARHWGDEVLTHLQAPSPAPPRTKAPRQPELGPEARQRLKRLLAVRDACAGALGLTPGLLCPRVCVEAVVLAAPRHAREQDLVAAGLRGWRLGVLAEAFLKALAAA